MATAPFFQRQPGFVGIFDITASRGKWDQQDFTIISRQALPEDSIGVTDVVLENVVVGSIVHVEILSTAEAIHTEIAASAPVTLTLPYYTGGNPRNNVRIKIRNASGSPAYQPLETQALLSKNSQIIFINQLLDE